MPDKTERDSDAGIDSDFGSDSELWFEQWLEQTAKSVSGEEIVFITSDLVSQLIKQLVRFCNDKSNLFENGKDAKLCDELLSDFGKTLDRIKQESESKSKSESPELKTLKESFKAWVPDVEEILKRNTMSGERAIFTSFIEIGRFLHRSQRFVNSIISNSQIHILHRIIPVNFPVYPRNLRRQRGY